VLLVKLLELILHTKGLVAGGLLVTAVIVTGTVGGQAVNLFVTTAQAAPLAFPTDPLVQIEDPKLGGLVAGTFQVKGWAVDRNSPDGPAVDKVTLFLDVVSDAGKLGDATLGIDRPDVAALLGEPKYLKSGWMFTWTAGTLEGNHTLFVVSRAKSGRVSMVSREINDPLVRFETPSSGASFRQEEVVDVTGWAIDRSDTVGDGIVSVTLYLDAKDDAHRLGLATLGQDSSELSDLYGERFETSGWSYSWDIGQTAAGEHTLYAVATSSVSGHTTAATRRVVIKSLEEEDEDQGPGCSAWAHMKNAAWHDVHGAWKTIHSDLQGLRKSAPGKGAKGTAEAAVNTARNSVDATVREAHREIQALAHSNKCKADAALQAEYDKIVDEATEEMEETFAAAKAAVALLPTEETQKKQKQDKDKGKSK
jgi:hypothetical protein